jgi:hypothetical protein
MLPLRSSLISFRTSNWFFLLVLIYFLLLSVLPIEAQEPSKKSSSEKSIIQKNQASLAKNLSKNPWSNIKGFRSAKFGMDQKNVYRAIAKDFKLEKSKVDKGVHPVEKTVSFGINVPELFRIGGTANIGYIFGFKSKKLMQVNVIWGQNASERLDRQAVIDTANMLRTHFLKKRYQEEGLVANGKLSDSSTMVFRGKDKKGKMVLLVLNIVAPSSELPVEEAGSSVSLVLSYISNPDKPDVIDISIKDDEF